MAITIRCAEVTFSLKGEDRAENIEGVDVFNYLGRLLYWLDDECPAVFKNIRKVRHVWSSLGKLIQRKREDLLVSAKF